MTRLGLLRSGCFLITDQSLMEQRIVRGDWSRSLIYQARAIMAYGRAEEL